MIRIYHNPRCKTSRAGMEHLKQKDIPFETREYLKEPLSEEELKTLFSKLDQQPSEVIRTQEKIYKEQYKGKEMNEADWIKALAENPKLLHRPIVETDEKAVLAQPPEKMDKII